MGLRHRLLAGGIRLGAAREHPVGGQDGADLDLREGFQFGIQGPEVGFEGLAQ